MENFEQLNKLTQTSFEEILQMQDWSEEERNEYLSKIQEMLEKRIFDYVLTNAGDERTQEFAEILSEKPQQAWNYLLLLEPNLEEVALFETLKLKKELLNELQ